MIRDFFIHLIKSTKGYFFLFLLYGSNAIAYYTETPVVDGNKESLQDVASNVVNIESNVHDIVKVVCILGAVFMFFSGLLKYKKHRANPIEASMGMIVTQFVIAILLIVIAFIPMQV